MPFSLRRMRGTSPWCVEVMKDPCFPVKIFLGDIGVRFLNSFLSLKNMVDAPESNMTLMFGDGDESLPLSSVIIFRVSGRCVGSGHDSSSLCRFDLFSCVFLKCSFIDASSS